MKIDLLSLSLSLSLTLSLLQYLISTVYKINNKIIIIIKIKCEYNCYVYI